MNWKINKAKQNDTDLGLLRTTISTKGATENAGVEKGLRYGQNCKGGKCRSKPCGTPTRDYIEKALSYFVILVFILLTK